MGRKKEVLSDDPCPYFNNAGCLYQDHFRQFFLLFDKSPFGKDRFSLESSERVADTKRHSFFAIWCGIKGESDLTTVCIWIIIYFHSARYRTNPKSRNRQNAISNPVAPTISFLVDAHSASSDTNRIKFFYRKKVDPLMAQARFIHVSMDHEWPA